MNFEKIIYLDAGFISSKYEEESGISPETTFSKEQASGVDAGADVGGMTLAVTGQTKETRTFQASSIEMLREIWAPLSSRHPWYESGAFKNYQGTKVFWLEGTLTLASWGERGDKEAYEFYQVSCGGERFALLTKPAYFSPGFSEILPASWALKGNIGIPVKCLVRVMWYVEDAKNYTAYPYIIAESDIQNRLNNQAGISAMTDEKKPSVRGLDLVGGALILLAILWAIFFPAPQYEQLGSYSIAQLLPMIMGVSGFICVIVARFKK